MNGRFETETKTERKLWAKVMLAWNEGHHACHREIAAQYTRNYPGNLWGWVALADVLVVMARYEEAQHALCRAEKLATPKFRRLIYVQWGHLYSKSCDLKKAERWYRRGIKCKATTGGLVYLGAALARQGRFSEAKRCHRRAVRLATDPPDEAYYNLGTILRAEGRYTEALECFNFAIDIDPVYEAARKARKDVLRALKLRRRRSSKKR